MNNEETIISQPQSNNNQAKQATSTAETTEQPKKKARGKSGVAIAGAAAAGAAVGSGATLVAEAAVDDEANNQQEENNHQMAENATESQEVEATADPQDDQEANQPQPETEAPHEVNPTIDEVAPNGETDYSHAGGADPVMEDDPNLHTASNDMGADDNQVQVLGVYEVPGDDGNMIQTTVLTDGQYIGAVIDVDYDGVADVAFVDYNQNQQIDEGEVYDVSNDNIQMQEFQNACDPQQEMMQQEHYAMNDNLPDYDNDADLQNA